MRATWVLTVASDRNSRWAISVLDNARATSSKTSCSRGVSASRAASAGRGGAPSPCTYRSSSRRVTAGATTASPAATARMAESRSGGPTSLSRKPLAPARKPAMTYSSKSKVVRMSTRVAGDAALIRRVASTPSSSGMRTSISTTSGWSCWACWTAASPLSASPTTRMSGWASSTIRNPIRSNPWSSTSRMLIGALTGEPALGAADLRIEGVGVEPAQFAGGKCGGHGHAPVHPDHLAGARGGDGGRDGGRDGGKRDVPAPGRVPRHPIGLGIGDGPAEPEPDPADLRHSDLGPATVEPADPAGRSADDPEALVPAGLAPGRPPVGAAVEIAPGLVEIAPGLLLDGLAAGGQPGVLRPGLGQLPTLRGEVRGGRAAGGAVGVGLLQRQVPAEPGLGAVPEQHRLLRRRRGQAEPGHPPESLGRVRQSGGPGIPPC